MDNDNVTSAELVCCLLIFAHDDGDLDDDELFILIAAILYADSRGHAALCLLLPCMTPRNP